MRNINEENKVPAELVRHPDEENTVAQDDLAPRGKDEENARPDETKRGDEENQIRSKDEKVEPETKKKKQYNAKKVASVSHAVSASIASVAIVLVVASVVLIGQNFFKKAPTYTVNSISYVDNASRNGIAYDITVSTNPDKVPLLLKSVYQDNLGREKDSESLDITEAKNYKGILPSMKYYDATYLIQILRTDHNSATVLYQDSAKYSRSKESRFYGFSWECHCTEPPSVAGEASGKAYYQLAYLDDFAYWDNFSVTLTKTTDASVSYTFACEKPYTDKHLVETISKEGGTYYAEIFADSLEFGSSPQKVSLLKKTVSI
jgi:hypothetical protein